MQDYKIINTSYANIYESPSFTSQLVTQALFWEKIFISNKKNNWYEVKSNDNYKGWVHKFYLIDPFVYETNKFLQKNDNWYWVIDPFLKLDPNFKDSTYLSFGSLIPCFKDNEYLVTLTPNNRRFVIDANSVLKYRKRINIEDVLSLYKKLIGIPYLWGGKSSFGYDCSGLIQILFNIAGYDFPRDCNEQVKSDILKEINMNELKVGNLIYFEENNITTHVGIFVNDSEFLHSSGCVKVNSIDNISKKFDKDLFKKVKGYYKVQRF